ncbi:hypothetical protein JW921_05610 [Candidatus Fermentibacterales bacterium]|nr:hypothetical protein [Candidatus Fermentibacterales bacterium]
MSDREGRLLRACGASSDPGSGDGRSKVRRSTLLIDPEGRVARVWRKVRVAGHAGEVLETLRAIPERRTDPDAGAGDS